MLKAIAKKILYKLAYSNPLPSKSVNLIKKYELGSYQERLKLGAMHRPHYGYCVYHGANLAKKLGYQQISFLEFGVAGGNGLLALEYHAEQVSKLLSIDISIYGFDTGEGLPKPIDYRDLPYHWKESFFKMDVPALKNKLKSSTLVLGNVKETVDNFFNTYNPAPIAGVMIDVDFYSSTVDSLGIFDHEEKYFLPRIFCYFDDTIGSETELYNDYTGMRLALNEFNQNHDTKKFGKPYHLLSRNQIKPWYHQIFIYHDFNHSKYNQFISQENQQLSLS